MPLFFIAESTKSSGLLKEVSILVPNRKEWVIPWAELAIPECGVVTHARGAQNFLCFVAAGADCAAFSEASSSAGKTAQLHGGQGLGVSYGSRGPGSVGTGAARRAAEHADFGSVESKDQLPVNAVHTVATVSGRQSSSKAQAPGRARLAHSLAPERCAVLEKSFNL